MSESKKINFVGIGKGIGFSLILTFVLLFIIALVCYFSSISDKMLSLFVFIATAMSVLTGALFVAKNADGSGLVHGLILGIGYLVIMFVTELIFDKGINFDGSAITSAFSILLSGMLGGILGINSK